MSILITLLIVAIPWLVIISLELKEINKKK
jgi:hypothetical protein